MKSWAEKASDIAIRYGKAAGMTEEELGEKHVAAIVSVASEMGKSCDGFSIVRAKYLASCKSSWKIQKSAPTRCALRSDTVEDQAEAVIRIVQEDAELEARMDAETAHTKEGPHF